MTRQDTYNGWTNHETWLVSLWLNNEEPLYHTTRRLIRAAHDGYHREAQLKEFVEELANEGLEGFQLDLMGSALSDVNWREIVQSFREDLEEDPDTEEGEDPEDEAGGEE